MPTKKDDRSYGGAAVAASGAGIATSMPVVGRIDRSRAERKKLNVDRQIKHIERTMPKSAGARRRLPGADQPGKTPYRQKAPATGKKVLAARQRPASNRASAPLRLQRKAAYRAMHELREHRKTIKPNLSIRSLRGNIAAVGIGAPVSYLGARHQLNENKRVSKKDDDQKKLAAGYAGAVGGAAAYQGVGYAAIPAEKRAAHAIKSNPKHHAKLEAHRAKYITPGTNKNDPNYRAFFRKYPKNVPGGKMRRALSWSHTGKTGTALTLGAAGATAAGSVALAGRKKKVQKNMSAFGVVH